MKIVNVTMELITDTLDTINLHYGKGTITNVVIELNGFGQVSRKMQYGTDTRRFRLLDNDFVLFLGRKRKLGYKIR